MQDEPNPPATRDAASQRVDRRERHRRRRFVVRIVEWVVVAVVLLGVAAVGTTLYTDRPSFCVTCHEMRPYHAAWASGPHAKMSCIECHVDPGIVVRFTHKFEALGEVAAHFSGDTKFPRATLPDVPDARCMRCHKSLPEKTATGFLHSQHASKGMCAGCHPRTGHDVSDATLMNAGIFSARETSMAVAGAFAVVDGGASNLPGHKVIDCWRCHNLAKTGCKRCHTPKHAVRGSCEKCHLPGVQWVFTHPKSGVDCGLCHKPPAKNHVERKDCSACHPNVGMSWIRKHIPGQDCSGCHIRPAKHREGKCPDCHKKPGLNWSFKHPGAGTDCETCHTRPSGHKPGACTVCHKNTGKNWSFKHPGTVANCENCHTRPSGHKPGACASCHKNGGRNWAFAHLGGSACNDCHTAPASHASKFEGTCSKCHHKAGVTFAFTHPRTRHNFSKCSKCHPNGYTSYKCTCH